MTGICVFLFIFCVVHCDDVRYVRISSSSFPVRSFLLYVHVFLPYGRRSVPFGYGYGPFTGFRFRFRYRYLPFVPVRRFRFRSGPFVRSLRPVPLPLLRSVRFVTGSYTVV